MIITIGSKVKDGEGNTYTLTEELGHGGFGCVYKAECEADKSVYAVKTLLYSFGDEVTAASFKNEVKISSEVSGEHVIHYIYAHDGDEYPELPPYIIMEYAEGGTLADQIEERKKTNSPYSKEELRNLFLQLVDGMKSINKKLVHRDIKPENILICNGICKITDFGLAKVASESTRTMSFKGYGTLQYIAPEAWKSEKNTIQMDIYSMGIVFYELALLDYPYDIPYIRYPVAFHYISLLSENMLDIKHIATLRFKMSVAFVVYKLCDKNRLSTVYIEEFLNKIQEYDFNSKLFCVLNEHGINEKKFFDSTITNIVIDELEKFYSILSREEDSDKVEN